jgi:hypothetical protein
LALITFLRNPISKTLTFDELETLLISLGFEKIDGAGSRIKFFNKEKDSSFFFVK